MKPAGMIRLPAYAEKALAVLERNGFEAWCVGGCVRDSLLGLPPGDWDVAASALPEETLSCFRDFRTIETGAKHGTITVLVEGQPVEITTFRSDGEYTDHRHPGQVRFSRRLEDDLSRRDFTVNALAYHPQRGVVDRFGGLEDLKRRTLRCVGRPETRFTEDALRILRCLRFASVLGFSIEKTTGQALKTCRELLKDISHERVRDELSKLLCGEYAGQILREYSEVIFTVLPELSPMKGCTQETPYHCYDVWEHTLHVLDSVPREPVLRWAALLHDCGKPAVKFFSPDGVAHFYGHDKKSAEIAGPLLERLRFSNQEADAVLTLIRRHGERPPLPEKRIKKLLGGLGPDTLFQLFALMRGDLSAKAPGLYEERIETIKECEALARDILSRDECLTLRDLAVNGNDLLALGFPKGPSLGNALNALLDEVLEGALPNEKSPLLHRAEEYLKKESFL